MDKILLIFNRAWGWLAAVFMSVVVCFMWDSAFAQEPGATQAKTAMALAYPTIKAENVRDTPAAGVYEVTADGNVFYFVPPDILLFGEMFRHERNLTAETRDRLMAEVLKDLPLDKAVKVGKGEKLVIEVSDPDCPFCRRGDVWFNERKDVTRYIFLMPLPFHKDSPAKVKNILCSKEEDRSDLHVKTMAGFHDDIKEGTALPKVCDEKKLDELYSLHQQVAKKLGVHGTPNYFINGKRIDGIDTPMIERLLAEPETAKGGR